MSLFFKKLKFIKSFFEMSMFSEGSFEKIKFLLKKKRKLNVRIVFLLFDGDLCFLEEYI